VDAVADNRNTDADPVSIAGLDQAFDGAGIEDGAAAGGDTLAVFNIVVDEGVERSDDAGVGQIDDPVYIDPIAIVPVGVADIRSVAADGAMVSDGYHLVGVESVEVAPGAIDALEGAADVIGDRGRESHPGSRLAAGDAVASLDQTTVGQLQPGANLGVDAVTP